MRYRRTRKKLFSKYHIVFLHAYRICKYPRIWYLQRVYTQTLVFIHISICTDSNIHRYYIRLFHSLIKWDHTLVWVFYCVKNITRVFFILGGLQPVATYYKFTPQPSSPFFFLFSFSPSSNSLVQLHTFIALQFDWLQTDCIFPSSSCL